jgi:hypothetical protein
MEEELGFVSSISKAVLALSASAATVSALVLGGYFFYDYAFKERIDGYLTSTFRRSVYEADTKSGREVCKSDEPGFNDMMEEMKVIYENHKGDQSFLNSHFTDAMDLFFSRLGVNPDDYAAFCKEHPTLSAWFSKMTANVTFSWVVGGAKIHNLRGNTMIIHKCHFREAIGEGGCVEMCKIPVEQYFTHRMNTSTKVSPQPREQGLGCKVCYGDCSPKELEW